MDGSSDSSKNSDEDGEQNMKQSKKKVVNPARKFCCFLTETGHSLNFVLLPNDLTDAEVTDVTELIQEHMGTISTSTRDIGSHFAVLVADETASWNYPGDVFKLSYIDDCVCAGRLLNISQYLKEPSKLYVENFDYMNVIYYRKYGWETIPEMFRLSRPKPVRSKPPRKESDDSDSSVDSLNSFTSVHSTTLPRNRKQTKSSYSRAEKEAMLRYVIEHRDYNRVKGKRLYKEMEEANICPIRTWQSLKDHFLRTLSKEITQFSFLTSDQKRKLKEALYPY